jgi:hypothetical protein
MRDNRVEVKSTVSRMPVQVYGDRRDGDVRENKRHDNVTPPRKVHQSAGPTGQVRKPVQIHAVNPK